MKEKGKSYPYVAIGILVLIISSCILADVFTPYSPEFMDSSATGIAPCGRHIFGTDNLGRDLFAMIVYGGRISLYIGIISTALSTVVAVVLGALSGLSGSKLNSLLMGITEIFLSIPNLLLVLFFQAIWGEATPTSMAVAIAASSWMGLAKVVRSEARQLAESEYILAAKTIGGGFLHILKRHLLPNFVPAIMFMVVTNVGRAIILETTLSFLGLGLPISTVSWGSLMSFSKNALLSNQWWMILLPGVTLVITLASITQIGEYIRKKNNKLYSKL